MQNTTELPPALAAERQLFKLSSEISMSSYIGGSESGTPLVLLHSINAAPSAMEMKPLFDHYASSRPVLAPEWPGFGSSDRPDTSYTPGFFADSLLQWMKHHVPTGADVIALSLGAEFVARAALKSPELFLSLTLISPTGMSRRQLPAEESSQRIKKFLGGKVIGPGLFRLLSSRASIRFFLNKAFVGKIPQPLIDYAHLTSHRPGASHAAFTFLSLSLFTNNAVDNLYLPLQQPVLAIYDRDPNVSFERLDEIVNARDNWHARRIEPSLGMPHFDHPNKVTEALDQFWHQIEDPPDQTA